MAKQVPKISFAAWFQKKIQGGHPGLKTHHREAVWAYFKAHSLSDHEASARYDEYLTSYGL